MTFPSELGCAGHSTFPDHFCDHVEHAFTIPTAFGPTLTHLYSVNSNEKSVKPTILLLIFLGNPGLPFFYVRFARALLANLRGRFPHRTIKIFVFSNVSQCDHSQFNPFLRVGLKGQAEHKQVLLDWVLSHHVGPALFYVIAHSIGTHMMLNSMKSLGGKIQGWVGLFPTIMELKNSPQGRRMSPILQVPVFVILLPVFLVLWLGIPCALISRALGSLLGRKLEHAPQVVESIRHPLVLWSGLRMAMEEFETVRQPPGRELLCPASNVILYYSRSDYWAPEEYYKIIKDHYGSQVSTLLCPNDLPHAFVLGYSEDMARKVGGWLATWVKEQKAVMRVNPLESAEDGATISG